LFGQFRDLVDRNEVEVEVAPGDGLREALSTLAGSHPELDGRILDEEGSLNPYAVVFLNGQNTRALEQSNPSLEEGDVVILIPSVGGG
jgi:MoaD family protein